MIPLRCPNAKLIEHIETAGAFFKEKRDSRKQKKTEVAVASSREVDDPRMGAAIDTRSREAFSKVSFSSFSPRSGFLRGNGAPLFFICFDYAVLL
jgi:hypothetical protein